MINDSDFYKRKKKDKTNAIREYGIFSVFTPAKFDFQW